MVQQNRPCDRSESVSKPQARGGADRGGRLPEVVIGARIGTRPFRSFFVSESRFVMFRQQILVACLLVPSFVCTAAAQEPVQEKPAAEASTESPNDPTAALALLKAAKDDASRRTALIAFVDASIATGAVYAGQYEVLRGLEWSVEPVLREWMAKAPANPKSDGLQFQLASINALRDVIEEAGEPLLAELTKIADDVVVSTALRNRAKYALAQFGQTDHVDAMIQSAMKNTTASDPNSKVQAWSDLADVYYNTRRYEDAAKAFVQVLQTIESVAPNFGGLPSTYYNCACSYALSGQEKEALRHIRKGLELGKRLGRPLSASLLQSDMDIRSLRGKPEFAALLHEHFGIGEAPAVEAGEAAASRPQSGEVRK